ncbi:MAG: hypothetical protein KAT68_10260 [Bacteroidales bacterium]|nr:hypothetical protein [Bacteroidales bacterium]
MKIKILTICFFVFLLGNCSSLFAQSKAKIKNVDFKLINDELIITYDIFYAKPNEKFNISVNIFTGSGKKINAHSFSGDINDNIIGSYNKKIIWNIKNDNVYLDEGIYVEVLAEVIVPALSKQKIKTGIIKHTSRGKAFILSALYPGWGTYRITQKNGNLVKGISAYTFVGISALYNKTAVSNFEDYKNSSWEYRRNKLFDATKENINISKIFAAGAATIWAIDLITVLSVKNKSKNTTSVKQGVSFGYSYNTIFNTPVLSLRYKF